jgi:hypothetical protein
MDYITITSYTTDRLKTAVIEDVERTSIEDVPMVTFVALVELNAALRTWIDETLA